MCAQIPGLQNIHYCLTMVWITEALIQLDVCVFKDTYI